VSLKAEMNKKFVVVDDNDVLATADSLSSVKTQLSDWQKVRHEAEVVLSACVPLCLSVCLSFSV